MEERRNFTRIPVDYRVVLTLPDQRCYEGVVQDVSLKGIRVQLDEPADVSGLVDFRVSLGSEADVATILGQAEVVRATEDGDLGMVLIKTDVDSLTHLRRLIDLNLGDGDHTRIEIAKW